MLTILLPEGSSDPPGWRLPESGDRALADIAEWGPTEDWADWMSAQGPDIDSQQP